MGQPVYNLRQLTEYVLGFACGLALGVACIDIGIRQAEQAQPPFPVITATTPDEPTQRTPLAP